MWEVFKDLLQFMKERKKFWLAPIVLLLMLVGALLVFGEGSAIGLLIYPLF